MHRNSPDQAFFARKIHKEFGPILNRNRLGTGDGSKVATDLRRPPRGLKSNIMLDVSMPTLVSEEHTEKSGLRFWNRITHREPRTLSGVNLDNNSELNLMEMSKFAGIMVSQEVSVDVRDLGDGSQGPGSDDGLGGAEMEGMQLARLGTTGGAMKEAEDPETYVDRLLTVCIEARG